MKKRLFALAILFLIALTFFDCNRRSKAGVGSAPLSANCYLKPDPGPCRMSIKRYYYDPAEKKCKEFIYGGCKGVVPFETLEECRKGCGCE